MQEGYELHYEWITENLFDGLSSEECKEVLDILDMYSCIKRCYENLEDKTGIDERKTVFNGFDGNNETAQMSYARYFMHDLDRYNELQKEGPHPDYNTHFPTLERYRRKLITLSSFEDKYNMTKDELIQLLES